MLPQGFIQDLLSRVDVVEVVGRHVELKKAGINLMGLCPFHAEKSPSFSVSPVKQFYYCFGCGASGDAIRFLTEHQGLSFIEAVRDLAQGAGLQVPEEDVSADEQLRRGKLRERRITLAQLLSQAAGYYAAQLRANPRAIDYLKRRGLTGVIAARFGLGFAPPGWRTLAGVFAHYDDPLLEEAGLVRQRDPQEAGSAVAETDRGRYDWFRDRIMFPIRSVQGEVIGFGGRVLDDSKPKYINSPETPVFSKGRELYGLYEARTALRDKGFALVVEGYMDVVALAQSGFGNAVATLGTACTADHVAKLFRSTDSVVFSFDGDAAGRRAASRALEAALPHATDSRTVRFLFLPPEHDPDSYVREFGAAAFEQAIAGAVPLSAQLVTNVEVDCDLSSAEGRSRMLVQARPLAEQLPAGLLREQVVAELARRGGVSLDTLLAHWGHAKARTSAAPAQARSATAGAGWRARRSRQPAPQTATRLDRVAWLLARHAPLWAGLSNEVHAMLCGQAEPYGRYFSALERILNDHHDLTLDALLADIAQIVEPGVVDDLLARVRTAHRLDPAPPAEDLATLLADIEIAELGMQLQQLTTSGDMTGPAAAEIRRLYARQAQLKARPARDG